MKKSVNLAKVINTVVLVAGFLYLIATVLGIIGGVEPFGFLFASALPMTLADAKGAKKVKALPFDIIDARTKGDKPAYALRFNKVGSDDLIFNLRMLCTAASVPFFSWPSKNVDGEGKKLENHVTYGIMPNGLDIVSNYQTINVQTAREVGQKAKEAKKAEREAKKANKPGKETTAAKIQAFKDLLNEGLITKEQFAEKVMTLS